MAVSRLIETKPPFDKLRARSEYPGLVEGQSVSMNLETAINTVLWRCHETVAVCLRIEGTMTCNVKKGLEEK
jgi:hypothetical protein